MEKIQRISRRYIVLINLLIVCIPVGVALFWAFFNFLPEGFRADLPVQPHGGLSLLQIILAFLATFLPMSVGLYGLVTLRTLFTLYARGIIFTADNVRCFYRLGYTLVAWVVASALFTPLISIIISYANNAGQRAIAAKLGIADFSTLIIAGVVLIVANVMNRGCELETEQAYTI